MKEPIMVACDLHDRSMLLKAAQGRSAPIQRSVANTAAGRDKLVDQLREWSRVAGGAPVMFAYEASGLGFGLYDQLTAAGFRCHVLAPTKIARSPAHRRRKTDERDADRILELLRGHVLAGNPLPDVWIPDPQTRDDRELVRTRLDLAEKLTAVKTQVQGLLKRHGRARPADVGKGWTKKFRQWLRNLTRDKQVGAGQRGTLASLLRQLDFLEEEIGRVELELARLAHDPRYVRSLQEMMKLKGVNVLTGLVILTELGDLRRFANRRQLGAYLGLTPCSQESGAASDRKGHITRQGSSRIRRVLCQATWVVFAARARTESDTRGW